MTARSYAVVARVVASISAALAPSFAGAYTCSVSVPALNFGNYDVFAASALQSATTLTLTCNRQDTDPRSTSGLPYTIALSTGSSTTYAQRTLLSGSDALGYNLYKDSARTRVWGDGNGGSNLVSGTTSKIGVGVAGTAQQTIYGKIPAQQNAAVGAYSDGIVVTVTF